jgi:transcriptional regulator with XRE-family HTH domain
MSDSHAPHNPRGGNSFVPLDKVKLRRARYAAGMTLDDLATAAPIDKAHLSRLENGWRQTTPRKLAALARALGVKPIDLMPDEPNGRAA